MSNASAVRSADPVKAYIYLRISKDEEKKGYGVKRQLPHCQREADTLGWEVIGVINENDTKASGDKPRPKYEKMLADLRRGVGNAVIGYSQDRVTRKVREAEDLLDIHDSVGIRIAIADAGELRMTNPDTRANFRNSTVNGMREIDWVSKRTTDEALGRAQRGDPNGPVPFGYRREVLEVNYAGKVTASRDIVHAPEADVLKLAAKRLLAGISMRQVVAELEAGTVRPRRAVRWNATNLRQYLLREGNAGRVVHQGKVMPNVTATRPAIFDAVTFGRLKHLLTDPTRTTNDSGSKPRWLLSGIATCADCPGWPIRVQVNKQKRAAYVCRNCLQRHWVEDLDAFIGALVTERLNTPAVSELGAEAYAELAELYRRKDALALEQTAAAELVGKGITVAQLVTMNSTFNAQLADLDAQIASALPSMATSVDLEGGWDAAGLAERRAAVRALFSVIELQRAELGKMNRRVAFTPEHVRVMSA